MFCAACGAEQPAADLERCAACGAPPLLAGRYRLEVILGQGAHGTTWRAVEVASGRVVAVKELPLRLGAPAKIVQLFEREAAVLQQLRHPGIPDYLDHFVLGAGRQRAMYLVMRFVDGTSLERKLRTHRFDEREVLQILDALLEVLEYLHALSPPVIHRDLKPANVLIEGERPVLIDFGSVRDALRDEDLGGSTVAGTFGFMAPEQFAGDALPATDLYGLGALAVALLTRKPPHTLQDVQQRLSWRPHANVGEGTAALLDRLLAAEIVDRPASAAEARRAVQRLLSEGTRIDLTGPDDPPPPPAPARPAASPAMPIAAGAPALPEVRSGRRLTFTVEAPGAVTDENIGRLITSIEHILGLSGSVDRFGSTVRWHSQPVHGASVRQIQVTLEAVEGGTRVLVSENLGQLRGGVYGGILGGVGGGVGGGLGWAPFVFIGAWAGVAFLSAVAVGTLLLAWSVMRYTVNKRTEELQQVASTLQHELGGAAQLADRSAQGDPEGEREERRRRLQAAKQREL